MLEILLLLVPYLPTPQLREVSALCLEKGVLAHRDGSVQKVGYRVLTHVIVRLLEMPSVDETEKETIVINVLVDLETTNEVAAGAVKVFALYERKQCDLADNFGDRNDLDASRLSLVTCPSIRSTSSSHTSWKLLWE